MDDAVVENGSIVAVALGLLRELMRDTGLKISILRERFIARVLHHQCATV